MTRDKSSLRYDENNLVFSFTLKRGYYWLQTGTLKNIKINQFYKTDNWFASIFDFKTIHNFFMGLHRIPDLIKSKSENLRTAAGMTPVGVLSPATPSCVTLRSTSSNRQNTWIREYSIFIHYALFRGSPFCLLAIGCRSWPIIFLF